MKMRQLIFSLLTIVILMFFSACEKEKEEDKNILPDKFKVDIPSSISNSGIKSSSLKSTNEDDFKGEQIYGHLRLFIAIGEAAADLTQEIIWQIKALKIEDVVELTYTSDDDNRLKHMVVEKDIAFDDQQWEYHLTITDIDNESNDDGGIAMQVFWNNNITEGIALLKPANININESNLFEDAIYSIEYSEKTLGDYEAHMIVKIADLPLTTDAFSVDAIKMFVGKKGDIVDVYGNSNHPNAKFFTDDTGFSWAFIASADENKNVATAEVGLPPCTLNTDSREVILKDYSIKNVLTEQINKWFSDATGLQPDQAQLSVLLGDTNAPGYFDADGFIQGGTAPNDDYATVKDRLNGLTPFNPSLINDLSISFRE